MHSSRGKTTPGSTAGSFKASTGARSRVELADDEPTVRPEFVDVSEHMNVLPAWEVGKVGVKMQEMSQQWASLLERPEVIAGLPRVRAKDGAGLFTGQGTVRQGTIDAMPADDEVRLCADGGDAWSSLPVVFKIGRQRVVRDGHHRLVRRLQAGLPIEYILVESATIDRLAATVAGTASAAR